MKRSRTVFAGVEFALGAGDRVPKLALLKILRSGHALCSWRLRSGSASRTVAAVSLAPFADMRTLLLEPDDPSHETVVQLQLRAQYHVDVTIRECDDALESQLHKTHAHVLSLAPLSWRPEAREMAADLGFQRAIEDLLAVDYLRLDRGCLVLSPKGFAKRNEIEIRGMDHELRRAAFQVIEGGRA